MALRVPLALRVPTYVHISMLQLYAGTVSTTHLCPHKHSVICRNAIRIAHLSRIIQIIRHIRNAARVVCLQDLVRHTIRHSIRPELVHIPFTLRFSADAPSLVHKDVDRSGVHVHLVRCSIQHDDHVVAVSKATRVHLDLADAANVCG